VLQQLGLVLDVLQQLELAARQQPRENRNMLRFASSASLAVDCVPKEAVYQPLVVAWHGSREAPSGCVSAG